MPMIIARTTTGCSHLAGLRVEYRTGTSVLVLRAKSPQSTCACSKCKQIRKMKLNIEQGGKGGLPPLVSNLLIGEQPGVNPPSRLVLCTFFFSPSHLSP